MSSLGYYITPSVQVFYSYRQSSSVRPVKARRLQ